MPDLNKCKICGVRRPRRFCPGVRGDICAICCGTEREVTVDCPLDCEYLQESRLHDRPPEVDPDKFPNRDIRVDEQFLRDHERMLMGISQLVASTALATPGAVDFDVREALEALIRTYRTLQSGLYYQTTPDNPVARAIQQALQAGIDDFRREAAQRMGMETVRDTEILGVLVFLQRLEFTHNNQRKRGRAFIDFLRDYFPAQDSASAPRVIV